MGNNRVRSLALITLVSVLVVSEIAAVAYTHKWTVFPKDNRIKVVTSTQEIAEIAKHIGGSRVHVHSLTKAKQNARNAKIYRSMVKAANEAHMLIRMGADYDPWVDKMLGTIHNSRITLGSAGYVDCSIDENANKGETQAEQHQQSEGDARSFVAAPFNQKLIAERILFGLIKVAPANETFFKANYETFCKSIDSSATTGKDKKQTKVKPVGLSK
jgi:ABC-type Zn uptake system ZnuABC Zn-binding protein ZnuA